MVIYADVVFILNLISTCTLIFAYSAIVGGRCIIWRVLLASVGAGLYAVIEQVFDIPAILRIAMMLLVILITFGKNGVFINTARFGLFTLAVEAVFMLIAILFGKNMYIAGKGVTVFSGSLFGGVIYAVSYPVLFMAQKLIKRYRQKRIVHIEIGGHKITLSLLYDSGNLLKYKGVSVAVVSWDRLKEIYPDKSYDEFVISAEERTIFNTVGKGGILPLITPDKATLNGIDITIKIAVADRCFKDYDGVLGG